MSLRPRLCPAGTPLRPRPCEVGWFPQARPRPTGETWILDAALASHRLRPRAVDASLRPRPLPGLRARPAWLLADVWDLARRRVPPWRRGRRRGCGNAELGLPKAATATRMTASSRSRRRMTPGRGSWALAEPCPHFLPQSAYQMWSPTLGRWCEPRTRKRRSLEASSPWA